ncbi:uncharacterized protein BO96DRAFT_438250 [Aspergillus niger CBS 101883]|uniref:Uncharacterized protein n=2 Tax=Aspergillus niger TaxID=5061 RepID=A2QJW9_ASPNC|nr:uncharacterized protein BO96DRAFT_438250 [Aspergillus niger CBS 101883]XP_059600659.1 hypothetical protein An04g08540 [Aspergillus niger]PYH52204.1 hypothetical protein BO96DRAFT_438250 [Aspergillus niger CBS 101883]CAK38941.1 hypothetical protein An04g08540 [Aspergillus niger]
MLYDKEAIETWIVVGHFQGVVGKQYGILKNHTLSPPAEDVEPLLLEVQQSTCQGDQATIGRIYRFFAVQCRVPPLNTLLQAVSSVVNGHPWSRYLGAEEQSDIFSGA